MYNIIFFQSVDISKHSDTEFSSLFCIVHTNIHTEFVLGNKRSPICVPRFLFAVLYPCYFF